MEISLEGYIIYSSNIFTQHSILDGEAIADKGLSIREDFLVIKRDEVACQYRHT